MIEAFHAEYEQRNGHRFESFPVEGVTYRVQLVVPSDKVAFEELPTRGPVTRSHRDERTPLAHLYPRARRRPATSATNCWPAT